MSRIPLSQHISSSVSRLSQHPAALKRVLVVGVAVLVLGIVCYSAVSAVVEGNRKRAEAIQAQRTRDEALRAREELETRKAWLKSEEGIRAQGYQDGMAREGEEVVRFALPKPEATPSSVATPADERDKMAGFILAGLLLFTLAFLTGIGLLLYRRRALRKRRPDGMLTPRSELRRRRRHAHEAQ